MEQKNLDTLLNNLQRNLNTKNYIELYKCYQQILNIDSRNIKALYALLEVASKIDTGYFYRGEVRITVYEIVDAVKTIFASNDNDLKEKAYNCYENCATNNYFIENWTLDEKEEYKETSGNLKSEIKSITNDITKLFRSPYYFHGTYYSPTYDDANFINNTANTKKNLVKNAPKDMEFVDKFWKKRFMFMAAKKFCKKFNFEMFNIKHGYNNFILVFGEKCIFRVFKNSCIDIFLLGANLNLEIYNKNLFFRPSKQEYGDDLRVKVFANQNKHLKAFNEVVRRVKDAGGTIKERDYDVYVRYE